MALLGLASLDYWLPVPVKYHAHERPRARLLGRDLCAVQYVSDFFQGYIIILELLML